MELKLLSAKAIKKHEGDVWEGYLIDQAKVTLRQALGTIDEAWPKGAPIYQDKLRAAIEQLREASR